MLDVLQCDQKASELLDNPGSFGGIPGKDVRSAIRAVQQAIATGAKFRLRSDIEGFFRNIPRQRAKEILSQNVDDPRFLTLFDHATETNLANLADLIDDIRLFPTTITGVAQGSPLSSLIGNLVLSDFDRELNGKEVTCIRYVDDFLILGPDDVTVNKAFAQGQAILRQFGMRAYDPAQNKDKAERGKTDRKFDFLGCQISPGRVRPSNKAINKFLENLQKIINEGNMQVRNLASGSTEKNQGIAQTIVRLNNIIIGWGQAYYPFCNDRQSFQIIDCRIDNMIFQFLNNWRKHLAQRDKSALRQLLHLHNLRDLVI